MNFAEKLRVLRDEANKFEKEHPFVCEPFVPDSEDVLYEKIASECIRRAKSGCSTLLFKWNGHSSSVQSEWEKYKIVRDNVIARLRLDGLYAVGMETEFIKPRHNDDGDGLAVIQNHSVMVRWS